MHRYHRHSRAGRRLPSPTLLSLLLTGLLVLPACRGDRDGTGPTTPDVGSIEVAANTTGEDPDPNGYTVTLDGADSRFLGASGTATFTDVTAGSHELALSETARNCQVEGSNPRTVSVTAGMTASTTFGVACTRLPRILFVSDRSEGSDVWKMASNGTDPSNLSSATSSDTDPRWSPDGSRVAFVSDRGGSADVFVMDAD
ncbi:MAG: hypothetical protein Q8W44_12685, partial [Candidatus Palauibacterales bacterium]|nr:hypothetical protein [Candidatus Palauibacterales bacterium]